ncbi:unnamed protein product, partial [Choristocarpus tenellus]
VGKSSLISTLVARHFSEQVPSVMTDVHIPPEESDDNVHCTISDSSAHPRNRDKLIEKMLQADSIVLVYDAERSETFDRLCTFWLPLIQ